MDLNAPLGMRQTAKARRSWWLLGLALVAVGAIGAGAVYLYQADPLGGQPYAVATIPPKAPAVPSLPPSTANADPMPTGSTPGRDLMRIENGVRISTMANGAARPVDNGPLVIDVSRALDEAARVKVRTPTGTNPEPRVSPGPSSRLGDSDPVLEAAMAVQPKPLPMPEAPPLGPVNASDDRPKIAIVVSGLGLDAATTRTATELMPPAVSFAFVPYGYQAGPMIAAAKAKGHEVLLQIPMQNGGTPAPGPHVLRVGESAADIEADLDWYMKRMTGFEGVANLLGGEITSDREAMTTLVKAVGDRGYYFLDDGTSKRSLSLSIAQGLNVPAGRADVILDATANPAEVQANFDRLVALAKAKGKAIGLASGLPQHLAAIATYASGLDAQGVALVPVSTIVKNASHAATTR